MELRILAVGDVVGLPGLSYLSRHLRSLKQLYKIDFCVVNGENANGVGILPGRGWGVFETNAGPVAVANLIGRCAMDFTPDNPFRVVDKILKDVGTIPVLIDFHAEATSEKLAMAYYLDGKVSALWGTHTHVPTADEQILPNGLGYQTDLGMTGPAQSVIGIRPAQSIAKFRGELTSRYEPADGPVQLCGAVFTVDTRTRRCTNVERVKLLD